MFLRAVFAKCSGNNIPLRWLFNWLYMWEFKLWGIVSTGCHGLGCFSSCLTWMNSCFNFLLQKRGPHSHGLHIHKVSCRLIPLYLILPSLTRTFSFELHSQQSGSENDKKIQSRRLKYFVWTAHNPFISDKGINVKWKFNTLHPTQNLNYHSHSDL